MTSVLKADSVRRGNRDLRTNRRWPLVQRAGSSDAAAYVRRAHGLCVRVHVCVCVCVCVCFSARMRILCVWAVVRLIPEVLADESAEITQVHPAVMHVHFIIFINSCKEPSSSSCEPCLIQAERCCWRWARAYTHSASFDRFRVTWMRKRHNPVRQNPRKHRHAQQSEEHMLKHCSSNRWLQATL